MSDDTDPIVYSQISVIARGILKRYSDQIDFTDERFVCIPIDVVEAYWEMKLVMPILAGLIEGTTKPDDFSRVSGQLTGRHLWHLIGHLKDLETALNQYEDSLD